MPSQAYFEDIQAQILKRLQNAQHSIRVAVAWFTDPELFEIIRQKAQAGIRVEMLLANHKFNHESGLDFEALKLLGASVWFVGQSGDRASLMHNKFCVIDDQILLFGSYNWTRKAQTNHESITVIDEDKALVADFLQEFDFLKAQQTGENETAIDWGKLLIRLETLLNVIRLEDEDDISYQLSKIRKTLPETSTERQVAEVFEIVEQVTNQHYSEAVQALNNLLNRMKQLVVRTDVEVAALQLEMRALEWQITSLEDEHTELEKHIYQFSLRHSKELGELILMILILKKQIAEREENEEEIRESAKDYNQYKQAHEANTAKVLVVLPPEQQKTIKEMYRQASKICHPDKVAEDQKEAAHLIFIELKTAYESNDLKKVEQIYLNIQQGVYGFSSQILSQKDKLLQRRKLLLQKRESIESKIKSLKDSENYRKIVNVGNWDEYFANIT
jgi:hypothetical protein